ncbi:Acidic leucine-rich nuclear phosphoprotein 32-related protein [Raphanus sativus]|nr:Acidic leucine-rich nuclear phosphoprotein 32-related protein [Raphanus sativus]
MDEIWERAVEAALDGQPDPLATRTLTLDGAVKCLQGRLPPPPLLEKFRNLHHLSIANIGVSSLEQFPRLPNLQKLVLSDNRITSGLEFLVEAGLDSLRDLDLSNNRIHSVEDLSPLARLKIVSLDLYECPVTRVGEYRARVFGLVKSLKFLDKSDRLGNERPESDDDDEEEEDEEDDEEDDEEEDGEEEEEDDDEEDPGSGEVDGDERVGGVWMSNGHSERVDGVVDVDEDEESDAEDEEGGGRANGFRLQAVDGEDSESESGEEIDEEEVGDDDVVEVHEIEDSDNEEDGVDDEEDEEEEEEDEVDNVDRGLGGSGSSTGRLMNAVEIDGHEQGDDDEDNDGETGEDDQGVEDDVEFGDDDDDDDDDGEEEVRRFGT